MTLKFKKIAKFSLGNTCAVALFIGAVLLQPTPASAQLDPIEQFDEFIILGASDIDAGNGQDAALTLGFPDPTPSSFGYFEGRFSNGLTYVDYVRQDWLGAPALASRLGGRNYAYGGASFVTDIVAVPSGFLPVEIPDFFEQIDEYIADGVNPDALHYLDFGGNDALALLFGMPPDEIITRSEEAIMIGGQALIDAGAQNFVIRTIDNFGAKRGVNGGNASVFDDLAPFYSAYNTAILDAYSTLARSNPGTTFYVFDLGPVFEDIFLNPERYGLDVPGASMTCLDEVEYPDCSGFTLFDAFHATTAVHEIVAQEFLISVNDQLSAPRLVAGLSEAALLSFEDSAAVRLDTHQQDLATGQTKIFLQGHFHDIDRESAAAAGFDGNGGAVFGGVLYGISPQWDVGFSLGYSDFDYQSEQKVAFDSKNVNVAISLGTEVAGIRLDLLGGYEHQNLKNAVRMIFSTDRTARFSTKGHAVGALAQFKFGSLTPSPWGLEPVIRLLWAKQQLKDAQEDADTSLNQDIDWNATRAFRGSLGLRFSRDWASAPGSWGVSAWLDAAALVDFDKTGPAVTVQLSDFGSFDRSFDGELGESRVRLYGGVEFLSPGHWSFALKASARLGGDVRSYQLGGSVNYAF